MQLTEQPTIPPEENLTVDPQLEICARWIDAHGDPADWADATWKAYCNTIACAQNCGAL